MTLEYMRKLKTDYNELVDKYNNYILDQREYKQKYYKAVDDYNYGVLCGQGNLIRETGNKYVEPIEFPFDKLKSFPINVSETIQWYNYLVELYNYKVQYYDFKTKFHEIILKSK